MPDPNVKIEPAKRFVEDLIQGTSKSEEIWAQVSGGSSVMGDIQPTTSSARKIVFKYENCSVEFRRKKIIIRDISTSRSWTSKDKNSEWKKGVTFLFKALGGKWIEFL